MAERIAHAERLGNAIEPDQQATIPVRLDLPDRRHANDGIAVNPPEDFRIELEHQIFQRCPDECGIGGGGYAGVLFLGLEKNDVFDGDHPDGIADAGGDPGDRLRSRQPAGEAVDQCRQIDLRSRATVSVRRSVRIGFSR